MGVDPLGVVGIWIANRELKGVLASGQPQARRDGIGNRGAYLPRLELLLVLESHRGRCRGERRAALRSRRRSAPRW